MIKANIFYSPLGYLGIAMWMAVTSCNNNETEDVSLIVEKDTTYVQTQIDLLNNSGEFLDFNLMVVEDGKPIEGASVEMLASLNGEQKTVSTMTDAEGMAYFDNLTIGGNILKISKENYSSMLGVINFKFENGYNYEITDGSVLPIAKNESAIVPLFSASTESVATITGKVTVDSDLTNKILEVPEGVSISANLNSYVISQSEGVFIDEFTMNSDGNYGTTTVNADGTYELKVPATVDGTYISMLIPELTMDQTVYAYGTLSEPSDDPVLLNIATSYGPRVAYTSTPSISGVKVDFSEPTAMGEGFGVTNIRKTGRTLSYLNFIPGNNRYTNGIVYTMTGGKNYRSTPQVVISDDTGTGAQAEAALSFSVVGLTLDSTFTGFGSGDYATIYFSYEYEYDDDIYSYRFANVSLNANADGEITQEIVTAKIQEYIDNYNYGFGESKISTSRQISRFYAELYLPSISADVEIDGLDMESSVNEINIDSNGSKNYLNPSISFEGGEPETPASISIDRFGTYWTFDLDNSNITNPYSAITFDVEIEYFQASSGTQYARTTSSVYDASEGYSDRLTDFLKVTDDGHISLIKSTSELRTTFYSYQEPSVYIEDQIALKPTAMASINADGAITYINVYSYGYGYIEKPVITISPAVEGLGGSGAIVHARGGYYNNSIYTWNGSSEIVSGGSGYVRELNQSLEVFGSRNYFNISGSTSFTVITGQSYIRNIDYGSGHRSEELN